MGFQYNPKKEPKREAKPGGDKPERVKTDDTLFSIIVATMLLVAFLGTSKTAGGILVYLLFWYGVYYFFCGSAVNLSLGKVSLNITVAVQDNTTMIYTPQEKIENGFVVKRTPIVDLTDE